MRMKAEEGDRPRAQVCDPKNSTGEGEDEV